MRPEMTEDNWLSVRGVNSARRTKPTSLRHEPTGCLSQCTSLVEPRLRVQMRLDDVNVVLP